MNRSQRAALVVGMLLALCGAAATYIPASAGTADCGWWYAPEWSESATRDLVDDSLAFASQTEGFMDFSDHARANAASAVTAYRACDDTLATRRTLSLGLLAGAPIAAAAILFVAGRRED